MTDRVSLGWGRKGSYEKRVRHVNIWRMSSSDRKQQMQRALVEVSVACPRRQKVLVSGHGSLSEQREGATGALKRSWILPQEL